jgi:hypothetical protein
MQKVNQEIYAKLIKHLIKHDATIEQLAKKTGLHKVTVGSLVRTFKKNNLVHICDWQKDALGRDQTMVVRWGFSKDKPRFAFSAADRQRLSRLRKKTNWITPLLVDP